MEINDTGCFSNMLKLTSATKRDAINRTPFCFGFLLNIHAIMDYEIFSIPQPELFGGVV